MKKFFVCVMLLTSYTNANEPMLPDLSGDDTCVITSMKKVINTPLKPDCTWSINIDGTLKTKTINGAEIAVLIGKAISKNEQAEWNVENLSHCSLQSIGVKLDKNGSPESVGKPLNGLLICSELHIDTKVYLSYWK
ncbi:hypothetical protein [Agarivorans gilvus]|uniref:Uncharacterized protein n=1 Tax=Agarivorans gilvus TaxID=680279 RepID=A0ABQ1I361_9ALTE|nr:hypothetical protein [Agarivorans gilvus]GGB07078.1 hypothetical protein GCM10007414_20500 [Agarivorans gilvus]